MKTNPPPRTTKSDSAGRSLHLSAQTNYSRVTPQSHVVAQQATPSHFTSNQIPGKSLNRPRPLRPVKWRMRCADSRKRSRTGDADDELATLESLAASMMRAHSNRACKEPTQASTSGIWRTVAKKRGERSDRSFQNCPSQATKGKNRFLFCSWAGGLLEKCWMRNSWHRRCRWCCLADQLVLKPWISWHGR